jgi:hypothetical protein
MRQFAGQPLALWVKCCAIGVASRPHKPAHALHLSFFIDDV